MKYAILFFAALLHLSIYEQSGDFPNRKSEIEKLVGKIYSVKEFQRVAGSLQLSIIELSDYPVIFPVRNPTISSGFGKRKHPVYGKQTFHTGIDFAETWGTPVYATGNGVVIRTGYDPGYGVFIEIRHAGGFRSFYAHLSRTLVNVGDSVWMCKRIACLGNSGLVTGCHLHYEIRKGNRSLNPIEWCCCLLDVLKIQTQYYLMYSCMPNSNLHYVKKILSAYVGFFFSTFSYGQRCKYLFDRFVSIRIYLISHTQLPVSCNRIGLS